MNSLKLWLVRLGISAGMAILIASLLERQIYGEWKRRLEKEVAKIEAQEKENERLSWLEPHLSEVQKERQRLEEVTRKIQMRLPSQDQFGQVIQDFTLAARERQLTLTIQAQPPIKRQGIQSGVINFTVESLIEGGYPRIRSFANWLRDYQRQLSFQEFEVNIGQKGQIALRATCFSPVMFDIPLPDEP